MTRFCCWGSDDEDESAILTNNETNNYNSADPKVTDQPQSEKKSEQINILKQKIKTQEKEINKQRLESQTAKKDVEKLNETNQKLQKRNQLLEKETENKNKLMQKVKAQEDTIKDLSNRLSNEMSTKVSADESSIENVAILNRPTNVADEYQQFGSSAWLEAKDQLDKLYPDNSNVDKFKLLAHIIQVCDSECKRLAENKENDINIFLSKICQTKSETSTEEGNFSYKEEIRESQNTIGDLLRNTSSKVDLEDIVQQVCNSIEEEVHNTSASQYFSMWPEFKQTDQVKKYIETITRIAWKMALQRPVMNFVHPDKKVYDEKCYELYWNSFTGPDVFIVEVYPALYHGKQLLAKGRVFCYENDTN